MVRRCLNCRKSFEPAHTSEQICSADCRRLYRAAYGRRYRAAHVRGPVIWRRSCRHCGVWFVPAHNCTRLCSEQCRQARSQGQMRRWRKKRRRLAELVEASYRAP